MKADSEALQSTRPPVSIFRKRIQKFRRLKRGYYSFLAIVIAYLISFILPLLINNKALVVSYKGTLYFPVLKFHPATTFDQAIVSEPNYRELEAHLQARKCRELGTDAAVSISARRSRRSQNCRIRRRIRRHANIHLEPTIAAEMCFARLAYGFNVSMTFALIVMIIGEGLGIIIGALIGYYGGKLDIIGQRGIEIWSSLPFLYTIIIVSSIVVPIYLPSRNLILQPSFWLLVVILAAFNWMGITYYVRGEFYREKAKDYVGAAISMGVSEPSIMFRHILPNALTPVVSFAPFTIVANIEALVALDFLGFGLPAPTPSWGELIGQGTGAISRSGG